MVDKTKCCGTCKYHYYESENKDWACINENAEEYTDFTEFDHFCEEWEGR